MDKKESVWLHIKGDEFAVVVFEENCKIEDVYRDMVEKELTSMTLDIDETYIEVDIKKFGEVDDKFEDFIKDNLCDYDQLKNENLFRVNLEPLEENDDSEEWSVEGMELGNLMFGNSRGIYPVERKNWQDEFHEFLDEVGIDGYGYVDDESIQKYETSRGGFENDVFVVNPYYWGDDESIAEEPNFIFKPTGYEIQWYKYPLRDSYSNKKITFDEFKDMLEKCRDSIER